MSYGWHGKRLVWGNDMTTRLIEIARKGDMRLYKRVARNGSSAWAWIHGPAYVIYQGLALYREFDWETDARLALNEDRTPPRHASDCAPHSFPSQCE